MIKDTLRCMNLIEFDYQPIISYYPHDGLTKLNNLITSISDLPSKFSTNIIKQPQLGSTQAQRWVSAIKNAFSIKSISSIVIIGADTPHIQPSLLKQILKRVDSISELSILGPSPLGGFYVLGIPRLLSNLESVFQQPNEYLNLTQLLIENNLKLELLPEMTDIDTYSDLITVYNILRSFKSVNQTAKKTYFIAKYTLDILTSKIKN